MKRLIFSTLALTYLSSSCAGTPDEEEAVAVHTANPFAYCSAVGSIDKPGKGFTGDPYPRPIVNGLKRARVLTAQAKLPPTVCHWRCMDAQVYACCVAANVPCNEKADMRRTPTEVMTDYCEKNPGAAFIPAVVTGRAMVWSWSCAGTKPVAGAQVFFVDQRGFPSDFWYRIAPN